MKYTNYGIILVCSFLLLSISGIALSIEVAPRITDREIVEKLVTLEVGQAALRSEIRAGQDSLRSETKAGQDSLRSEMKAGQDALGKRMDDMNDRMGDMTSTMHALFMAVITLIVALFAFIAWDRRTMLKPIVDHLNRLDRSEIDIMRDLDINHQDGSLLNRLVSALRELAKDDKKIASVLRSFSLL